MIERLKFSYIQLHSVIRYSQTEWQIYLIFELKSKLGDSPPID